MAGALREGFEILKNLEKTVESQKTSVAVAHCRGEDLLADATAELEGVLKCIKNNRDWSGTDAMHYIYKLPDGKEVKSVDEMYHNLKRHK